MKNRRMYWQIVDKIEYSIESGEYHQGQRLPSERELSETFEVSRPTIREAIIALEARGRVKVKISSGVYVLKSNKAKQAEISAYELTQARAVLEGEACALAANLITEEELTLLEQTLIDMENNFNSDLADQNFHKIIARATRNNAISLMIEKLWILRDSTPEIKQAYQQVCRTQSNARLEEHKNIVIALRQQDPKLARDAMHQHFNRMIHSLFDASEANALEEAKRQANEKRELYSLNHLLTIS